MQLEDKLQETAETKYLPANKQKTKYQLTYSDVSKERKRYD